MHINNSMPYYDISHQITYLRSEFAYDRVVFHRGSSTSKDDDSHVRDIE